MYIVITLKEASEKGILENVCAILGYDIYTVGESLRAEEDDEVKLTFEQATKMGLIKESI